MQISGKAMLVTGGASAGLDADRIAMGTGRSFANLPGAIAATVKLEDSWVIVLFPRSKT